MFKHWRDSGDAASMKVTLVHARMAVDEMRVSLTEVRGRRDGEQRELDTCRRRLELARGIGDAETVRVALRFESQHVERVTVLARKVEAQEAELALAEREVEEMAEELRRVMGGAGAPIKEGEAGGGGPSPQKRARDAAALDAELRLAELKRRMGK
jgi:hypothetical protein